MGRVAREDESRGVLAPKGPDRGRSGSQCLGEGSLTASGLNKQNETGRSKEHRPAGGWLGNAKCAARVRDVSTAGVINAYGGHAWPCASCCRPCGGVVACPCDLLSSFYRTEQQRRRAGRTVWRFSADCQVAASAPELIGCSCGEYRLHGRVRRGTIMTAIVHSRWPRR